MLHHVLRRFIFSIERFLMGGAGNQLLLVAAIITMITFLGGLVNYSITPQGMGFLESIWWSFLRLTDPGYLGDDQGGTRRLISTFLTVSGYVLFMGSLVAIMSQWLNSRMRTLESGLTPVSMRGHMVILGWNDRTPVIISEILNSRDRLNRFLEAFNRRKFVVTILAQQVSRELVAELRDSLGNKHDSRMVIFRSGDALDIDHLGRVDVSRASVVIVPGMHASYRNVENIDSRIIMILKNIEEISANNTYKPRVIAEILDVQRIGLPFYNSKTIDIIPSSLIASRVLAQTLHYPGIGQIFTEILNNDGDEIYLEKLDKDMNFGDLINRFPHTVPVGYLQQESEKVILNPPDNMKLHQGDQAILLAEDYSQVKEGGGQPWYEPVSHTSRSFTSFPARKVLVVGWNIRLVTMFHELQQNGCDYFTFDVFSVINIHEREDLLKRYRVEPGSLPIQHYSGNSTFRYDYAQLDLGSYHTVLYLANDWIEDDAESDARTLTSYLLMDELLESQGISPYRVVELLDRRNRVYFDRPHTDIIISSLLISYALAQVSLMEQLSEVFDELFATGGNNILFRDVQDYGLAGTVPFNKAYIEVRKTGDLLLGYRYLNGEASLNPSKDTVINCGVDLSLVVLSSES